MWYNKFNWTILVFLVLFTLVTGSCLEYGHSCWGAHGKRSGNRPPIAIKQAPPYADNLAEQLMSSNDDESNNNNNNVNNVNNNKLNDLPLTVSALSLPRERGVAVGEGAVEGNALRDVVNDGKWTQLLRQHRYKLRQLQLQRQFDAADAAESWRKLQQAMVEAEQQQQQQEQQQRQQQRQLEQLPIGDFFELAK